MEAVAALGVASAIVQLVGFTGRLVGDTRELCKSGKPAPEDNLQLLHICDALSKISDDFSDLDDQLSEDDNRSTASARSAVRELATACKRDCDSLKSLLETISVPSRGGQTWSSLRTAIRSAKHRSKIEAIQQRILRAQSTLGSVHLQRLLS